MANRTSTRIANRARSLRKNMTEPKIMLWSRLKGRGTDKPIFRRQFAYETIILDFYCPAAKLAVEVDGATHWDEEGQAKDSARDAWLASRGISVMRLPVGEIYRDLGAAADAVVWRALELIARP
jgi:very-short-patch-repair endonuclease